MVDRTNTPCLMLQIAALMLLIGLAPQLRADVGAKTPEDDWVQTNGPYGGDISALYATPEGVLFAGTEGAGIFRSTDLGDSWTPVNTGVPESPGEGYDFILGFAQKRNMLYAGTSSGLYASVDGGDTWHYVPTFERRMSVSGIVTIGGRVHISTYEAGVWYSDDMDSWMPMNDGLENRSIRELSKIGTTVLAGTEDGAFRKRIDEDLWTPINTGFVVQPMDMAPINAAREAAGDAPVPRQQFPSGARVDAFAAMGDLLYIGILLGGDDGLFRSDDEGDSWIHITSEEMKHTVEALTTFGTTLYAGTFGSGVFRSEDTGDSWTTVNNGLTDLTVSSLLAVSEDTVFAGTSDDGIFRTRDSGSSWVETNTGVINTAITDLAVIGKTIYASIGHRLVYSTDGGEVWHPVQIPSVPITYHFPAVSTSEEKLYIAAFRFAPPQHGGVVGGIFQVDPETQAFSELATHSEAYGIQCMERVGTTFYVGTQGKGVFQWDQKSEAWTHLGLEGNFITVLLVNGKKIYAGTRQGEIFIAAAAGKPWKLSSGTLGNFISDIKSVGATLYATSWGKGIFRSTNDGNSWTPLNQGFEDLGDLTITTIELADTDLYIGTYSNGVFRWEKDRQRWEPIGSLSQRVDSLVVLDGFLYAGTVGRGVFKIPIKKPVD